MALLYPEQKQSPSNPTMPAGSIFDTGSGPQTTPGAPSEIPRNTLGTNVVTGDYASQDKANRYGAGAPPATPPPTDLSSAEAAYKAASAPEDPTAIRNRFESRLAAEISAVHQQFSPLYDEQKRVNQEQEGRTRAGAAASGLLGSDFGTAMMNNTAQAGLKSMTLLSDQETAAITGLYSESFKGAESEIMAQREENIAAQKQMVDFALKKLDQNRESIRSVAGTVPITSLDSATYQNYYKAGGFQSYGEFENYWNAARTAALRPNTVLAKGANGENNLLTIGPDGKIQSNIQVTPPIPKPQKTFKREVISESEDAFGNKVKQYGTFDETTGQIVADEGGGGGGGGSGLPSAGTTVAAAPDGTHPEYLKTLPQSQALVVKALSEYKYPLPSGFALRSPYFQKLLTEALEYDPSFDATQYNTRVRLRQDFTSGKGAQNIRSINTAVGHLKTLQEKATNLGNTWFTTYNTVGNYILSKTGDKRVVEFGNAANAVQNEMASVFKGTGATDQEIKAWRENLDSSQSPEQLKGSIDTLIELMGSRLQALGDQWEKGMGKPKDFRILSDQSRSILQGLGADVNNIDPTAGTDNQQPQQQTNSVKDRAMKAGFNYDEITAAGHSDAEIDAALKAKGF